MPPVKYPKEQMHRIKYTKLTPEQIGAKLAAVGDNRLSQRIALCSA
jgi:hypothetical protein